MRQPSAILFERAANESWADGLAGWENEGGFAPSAPRADRSRPPDLVVEGSPPGDPDEGIADRHTLGIMQVSLLVLNPVLAAMAIFWGAVAGRAPSEALG